jgi:hypothetical protein
MSRNRLSELQTSQNGFGHGYDGYTGTNDLESGDGPLAGERYELQERRPVAQLSLSDYLDEVAISRKISRKIY